MVAIPYNDSITKMYVIKPRKPDQMTLAELLNRLNYTTLDNTIDKLTSHTCIVRFPKMDLQYNANLADTFKSLGLQSIFNPEQANFALMIDDTNVNNKTDEDILTLRFNDASEPEGLISKFNDAVELKNLRALIDALPNPGVHIDKIIHNVKITINGEYGLWSPFYSNFVISKD